MSASLRIPLAAAKILAFLAVSPGFTRLEGVVHSFVLASFQTEYVGEERLVKVKKR